MKRYVIQLSILKSLIIDTHPILLSWQNGLVITKIAWIFHSKHLPNVLCMLRLAMSGWCSTIILFCFVKTLSDMALTILNTYITVFLGRGCLSLDQFRFWQEIHTGTKKWYSTFSKNFFKVPKLVQLGQWYRQCVWWRMSKIFVNLCGKQLSPAINHTTVKSVIVLNNKQRMSWSLSLSIGKLYLLHTTKWNNPTKGAIF